MGRARVFFAVAAIVAALATIGTRAQTTGAFSLGSEDSSPYVSLPPRTVQLKPDERRTARFTLEGRTGTVVDGADVAAVADEVAGLLADPDRARAMGRAGREWVEGEWRWDVLAARLRGLLAGP